MLKDDAILNAMIRFNYCQSYFMRMRDNADWQNMSQEEKMNRAEQYADHMIEFGQQRECV